MDNAPLIRALLVFPDANTAEAISSACEASEEPVETGRAFSVADAIAAEETTPFDFIVAAVRLPDGGAIDIARKIPAVPCLVAGPASEQDAMDEAITAGAVDTIKFTDGWEQSLASLLHRLWRIRRRLTIALGHAAKRYEDLVEALPDIVYELDAEGHFTFINQSVKILGYTPEELLGEHFSTILFEEDVPHVSRDQVLKLYENNRTGVRNAPKLFDERRGVDRKTENLELRLKRKDGSALRGGDVIATVTAYGEIASAGAYRNTGAPMEKVFVGTVGIIRDITLRRKSEDMLRKMYQAVDQSPVAVAVLDRDLNIEYVNPAFFDLTGTGPDQAIGKKIGEFLGEASDRTAYDDLVSSVRADMDWQGELRCPRAGGDPFWSSVLLSAIRAPSGAITHFLCLMENVTRKRALDDLLKQAKETAEEANRIKSEFLANMSHELRTPLAGVMSLSDVLLSDAREDQIERLRSIRASASSLLGMLNDLLDLSKIEARAVELRNEDFDLRDFVGTTLTPFKASAEQKNLAFHILVEDGGFPCINTDRGRLAQIISNLAANAVKFTDEGSVDIRFAVRAKDDVPALFVSVRDTGIGISGVDQQKLFKHFAQVDSVLSRKYGGTGLGLAISKELALRMGGDIWVESAPGLGSTFSFYIPVKPAGVPDPMPEEEFLPAPRAYNLLLAEDNPVNRDYLRFFLEKAGHRVKLASDGYEALASLEKGDFDAVLMDIQMPGLDGIEATTTIRAYTGSAFDPRIPVIALTAFAEEELGAEYQGADFDAHATKPVNPRTLVSLIETTLRKKDRFDVDRIKRQYAASVDDFRRLLMIASQDLPKRIAAFESAHETGDQETAKSALHGVVNVLSAIGAVRALQLVKRYRKAVVDGDSDLAAGTASDLLAEVEGIRQQVKKTLGEL